jgi:hypothetical protein
MSFVCPKITDDDFVGDAVLLWEFRLTTDPMWLSCLARGTKIKRLFSNCTTSDR